MSCFSGKCDLFDHIMMTKQYDAGNCFVSDELECFEEFKKRTDATIYMRKQVFVSENNIDFVSKNNGFLTFSLEKRKKSDRPKAKLYDYYQITFFGKSFCGFSPKVFDELNENVVCIDIKIKFNTIIDIIPYYPHIISAMSRNKDEFGDIKEHIVISNHSYADDLESGILSSGGKLNEAYLNMSSYYKTLLQAHYVEVCEEYFLQDKTSRFVISSFKPLKKEDVPEEFSSVCDSEKDYYIITDFESDYMHEPYYLFSDDKAHMHYSSPVRLSDRIIKISQLDVENFLSYHIKNDLVKLCYYKKLNRDLHLK